MYTTAARPLAHDLDAAWLIALYHAIHGGDPPETAADVATIAGQMIARLSTFAFGTADTASVDALRARLADFNVRVGDAPAAAAGSGITPELRFRNENGFLVIDVEGIEIIVPGGGPRNRT